MELVFFILTLGTTLASAQSFSPTPYLDDFHQLLSEMSSHYANLEWAANDRRVDLPKVRALAEERLRNARNDEEAHRAFQRFINAFGDGHIELDWPRPEVKEKEGAPPLSPSVGDRVGKGKESFCDRLNYTMHDNDGGIDWSIFSDYKPLAGPSSSANNDADDFPGGLLHLNKRVIGIIRIGLFSEHAHPALCRQAQLALAKPDDSQCSDKCEDDFEYAVADLVTAALERRIGALTQAGATELFIDITGNGGGSDWVEPAARVLTPIPLKSPRIGFVKSDHWTKDLQSRLNVINSDFSGPCGTAVPGCAPSGTNSETRTLLTHAADVLKQALTQNKQTCDRSILWTSPPSELHCTQTMQPQLFTSGTLAYAKPGAFPQLKSRYILFNPLHYHYTEGVNRLPLTVLVDHNTASSAEYFAAMLQDNHAARIVGSVTTGCGCGYTNGGIPTTLKNSHARVRLPDCIRFRARTSGSSARFASAASSATATALSSTSGPGGPASSSSTSSTSSAMAVSIAGENEVAGITPDTLLPWSEHVSHFQQATILKHWLESSRLESAH